MPEFAGSSAGENRAHALTVLPRGYMFRAPIRADFRMKLDDSKTRLRGAPPCEIASTWLEQPVTVRIRSPRHGVLLLAAEEDESFSTDGGSL